MIASQIAWHSRNAVEQGIISKEAFSAELAGMSKALSSLPEIGKETVFLKSGYAAHIHQIQPPRDALAYPLPPDWGLCERLIVKDVSHTCHVAPYGRRDAMVV